jgi:bifunctional DNA-binding transcriptional regulator/antitoxin component of YhaV-PrlF toxin-antitoxin module
MSTTFVMGDSGRIYIPPIMLKKLKINPGQTLKMTATENLIIIEKCEGEEE